MSRPVRAPRMSREECPTAYTPGGGTGVEGRGPAGTRRPAAPAAARKASSTGSPSCATPACSPLVNRAMLLAGAARPVAVASAPAGTRRRPAGRLGGAPLELAERRIAGEEKFVAKDEGAVGARHGLQETLGLWKGERRELRRRVERALGPERGDVRIALGGRETGDDLHLLREVLVPAARGHAEQRRVEERHEAGDEIGAVGGRELAGVAVVEERPGLQTEAQRAPRPKGEGHGPPQASTVQSATATAPIVANNGTKSRPPSPPRPGASASATSGGTTRIAKLISADGTLW